MQHGRVHVRVVSEARLDVAAKRLQATRCPLAVLAGALPGQVAAHRLAVSAGVTADRRHRPPARSERVDLHVVLPCKHPPGALLDQVAGFSTRDHPGGPRQNARAGVWIDSGSPLRGSPPSAHTPGSYALPKWGISVIRAGEKTPIRPSIR